MEDSGTDVIRNFTRVLFVFRIENKRNTSFLYLQVNRKIYF